MILYFSGTGNTQWAARQIAQSLNEELLYIPDLIREGRYEFTLKEEERLGFCFPTHGWQPPRIVREFIRRSMFHVPNSAYCWALTTCGDNTGEAMTIFTKECAAKGLELAALFSVIMPETYVCLPFMYTDTAERENEKIGKARVLLMHIADTVRNREKGIRELEKGAIPRIYSYVIGGYFNRRMITDKKFTVDTDICIQCGKCAKVCPVDNIKGTPPLWLHEGKCTCCLACYHYCPVHAINYGSITRRRGQYFFNRREARKS